MRIGSSWQGNWVHFLSHPKKNTPKSPFCPLASLPWPLSIPPHTPWLSCLRTLSLCTCRRGRRHSSAQTRTPWTGSRQETGAKAQERETCDDRWMETDGEKQTKGDVRKDVTHHLILNHTRHLNFKTVCNYFQTDNSTAPGC